MECEGIIVTRPPKYAARPPKGPLKKGQMWKQRTDIDSQGAREWTHEPGRRCPEPKHAAPCSQKFAGPGTVHHKKKKKNKGRKKRGLPSAEQMETWGHGGLKKERAEAMGDQKKSQPGWFIELPTSSVGVMAEDEASQASEQLKEELERAAMTAVKK